MKYGKRNGKLLGIILWAAVAFLAAGCGRRTEEADLEAEACSRVAEALPKEESVGEMKLAGREKTKNAIRYQVYVKVEGGDFQESREKYYTVSFCRRNGKWVCSGSRGVRLVEEKSAWAK